MKMLGEIVAEVIRELLQEIRETSDLEAVDERRPKIVGEDPEQRREIGRVDVPHHLVEGGRVTGVEQLLHPGGGLAQPIRREVHGEGFNLTVGHSRQLFVFVLVVDVIRDSPPDTRAYCNGPRLSIQWCDVFVTPSRSLSLPVCDAAMMRFGYGFPIARGFDDPRA